jgi:PAT family beta-lactamase induction signal transducer AmpG
MGVLDVFRSRRVLVLTLLGFSSGLPIMLTGQTLTAWMTAEGVNLKTIGAFAMVALAYNFKFAWAPLLDRYRLPYLGRRRGWILTLQLLLVGAIATLGTLDPKGDPATLAIAAVVVAFLSASQDVVVDAFNTDTLEPAERPAGMAMYVMGYRIALLITGTLALIMADHLPWRTIYWSLAALMSVGIVGTILAREPAEHAARPTSLVAAVWRPLHRLFTREGILIALAFVALYRLGDAFGDQMKIPFLKTGVGFSFTEIATLNKMLGFAGTVTGGLLGGVLVVRMGLRRSLIVFGALMALTNLLYVVLAMAGKSLVVFGAAVLCDTFATGLGTGAFIAFLMSLCDRGTSATQYALLTALSTLGARLFSWVSADVVKEIGWSGYWGATAAIFLPAGLLALFIPIQEKPKEAGAATVSAGTAPSRSAGSP